MASNPLMEIQKFGQSIWFDNIRRTLLTSGGLKKMIDEDGLRGMTSNPTIFEKAIAGSTDYNDQLQELALQGKKPVEIYEDMAIRDIQMAADIFLPVFERTKGLDGYVSFEVSPHLGNDTQGTISEAKRLWQRLDRRNVMIKVPGTEAGIPAIEELIADGLNINVTLIFSTEM
jgi:transaldolase